MVVEAPKVQPTVERQRRRMVTSAENLVDSDVGEFDDHRCVAAFDVIADAEQSLVDRPERPDLSFEYFASALLRSVDEAVLLNGDAPSVRQRLLNHQNDGEVVAGADLKNVEVAEAFNLLRLIRLEDALEAPHSHQLAVLGHKQNAIRISADLLDPKIALDAIPNRLLVANLFDVCLKNIAIRVDDVEKRVTVRRIFDTFSELN